MKFTVSALLLLFVFMMTADVAFRRTTCSNGSRRTRSSDRIGRDRCRGTSPICDEGPNELELLALDIARRAVLAHYPHAGRNPMRTLQVKVRPEGDVVHTYARLAWAPDHRHPEKHFESEVFASVIYTTDIRRIFDISYKDNRLKPFRLFNRRVDLVSKLNEDLERRDPLRMATPLVGNRQDLLVHETDDGSCTPWAVIMPGMPQVRMTTSTQNGSRSRHQSRRNKHISRTFPQTNRAINEP